MFDLSVQVRNLKVELKNAVKLSRRLVVEKTNRDIQEYTNEIKKEVESRDQAEAKLTAITGKLQEVDDELMKDGVPVVHLNDLCKLFGCCCPIDFFALSCQVL